MVRDCQTLGAGHRQTEEALESLGSDKPGEWGDKQQETLTQARESTRFDS